MAILHYLKVFAGLTCHDEGVLDYQAANAMSDEK